MTDNNSANPALDIEQILRTLAGFSGTPTPQPPAQEQPQHPLQHRPATASAHPASQPEASPQARSRPPGPNVNSSTITEWKHGLRCLNKLAAQNPQFETSIQKLIKDQERNVRDWENGRQRLIAEQQAKRENERSQRAAINLPGLLDNAPLLRTPEREQEELDDYYHKVYRACRQMSEIHKKELQRLGVPFFCLRSDLLRAEDANAESSPQEDNAEKKEAQGPTDGTITQSELVILQKKMLNHLLELYGD